MEYVHFQIDGEYITDLARTMFWDDDRDYEDVERLLLQCLVSDQSEDTLKTIVQQIIEGRKKLVGINELELIDDNENVRPIYKKIKEQFRKVKIAELKNTMTTRMLPYIDPYCTVKSPKAAKELSDYPWTYEQCATWFWYSDDAIDHTFMRPHEPGDGMLMDEDDDTDCGLWLYRYPDIAYDAMRKHDTTPYGDDHDTFWRDVYDIIKDDFRFRSKYFQNRNERYLAYLRMKKNVYDPAPVYHHMNKSVDDELKIQLDAVRTYTDKWLADHANDDKTNDNAKKLQMHEMKMINAILHDESDINSRDRMYAILPDEYDRWEGLIAPNGDFYSCEFGGHNTKAYFIIATKPELFPNIDVTTLSMTDALDDILKYGWCATRYMPMIGNYINVPANGRVTNAQKNAIFDAKVKHDINVDLSPIGF